MAERRMFAKTIIDSDAFLDMPLSTQSLYFHLSMRADDDGFINNPKRIQRMLGCGDDDLKLLMAKRFILSFESGVIVIKHWKIHNYIRNDRYKTTVYQEEKKMLTEDENKSYTVEIHKPKVPENVVISTPEPLGIPVVDQESYQMETQVRLGKDRLGKDSKENKSEVPSSRKYSDEHLRLAQLLQNNLKEEFSKEMGKANINKWADVIRLMEERDHVSIEQIEYVLNWLPTNSFWFGNIRSASKLREQFEKLVFEIKQEKERTKKASQPYQRQPIRKEVLPDWADSPNVEDDKQVDPAVEARLKAYLDKQERERLAREAEK